MGPNTHGIYDDPHNRRRLSPNLYMVDSSTLLEAPSASGANPSTNVGQNRWRYELKPAFPHRSGADLTADPVVVKLQSVSSDSNDVFGFNMLEIQNDDQTIFGLATSTIPAGFTLEPVPDGSLVVGYYGTSVRQDGDTADPYPAVFFQWPNQFSGSC